MRTDLGTAEGIESREPVHFVTQQTRFALINNILQHPEQLPSMYELEELNPSVSDATVYKHIQKLIDAGIVKEVALDDDQRRQGDIPGSSTASQRRAGPSSTNTISPREETLQQIYETISDKPEKMVKYENSPPGRRVTLTESSVSVLDHRSISYSPASSWNVPRREPVIVDLAVRLEVAEQDVGFVFEIILFRLLSEILLVDVGVAEQEETVLTIAASVVD